MKIDSKTFIGSFTPEAKDSARNNLDNFCRKCATGSVDFLFSKPQHSWLCEDFENKKWAEDLVQLRIRKSKLFLAES